MNFREIAHMLSFGYYRPHLQEDSFESGWNLISQKESISAVLKAAFEAGKQSIQVESDKNG